MNRGTRKVRNKTAPVQIPPFHYTQSQERRAWTCAIYPHAEMFLKLPGAIKWSSYKATHADGDLKVQFNKAPYYALGGAVEEVYALLYKREIKPEEQLHKRVDPTGDLDIRICPMSVLQKGRSGSDSYYKKNVYSYENEPVLLHNWFEDAVNWLVDEIVAYFKPLERMLNAKFPTALPFIKEYDHQSRYARRIERVGPLTIIHTSHLQSGGTDWVGNTFYHPLTKVQVKLTIPMPDLIARAASGGENRSLYTDEIIQDHMVEFGFWEEPNARCEHDSFIYRPYNLRVRDLKGEIYGCYTGLKQRLELVYNPYLIHKSMNYVYRLRFLLHILYSTWNKTLKNRPSTSPIDENTLYSVADTLDKLLDTIYKATRGEKRSSIWFIYIEIIRQIKPPLQSITNRGVAEGRFYTFIDMLYKELTPDSIKELSKQIGSDKRVDIETALYQNFMDSTRDRYIFKTPIGCDDATPAEAPQVEAEKKRLANRPPPLRGPTLAELAELPELEKEFLQERRGNRPIRMRSSANKPLEAV